MSDYRRLGSRPPTRFAPASRLVVEMNVLSFPAWFRPFYPPAKHLLMRSFHANKDHSNHHGDRDADDRIPPEIKHSRLSREFVPADGRLKKLKERPYFHPTADAEPKAIEILSATPVRLILVDNLSFSMGAA